MTRDARPSPLSPRRPGRGPSPGPRAAYFPRAVALPLPPAWPALLEPYLPLPVPQGAARTLAREALARVNVQSLGPFIDRVVAPLTRRDRAILWDGFALRHSAQQLSETFGIGVNGIRKRVSTLQRQTRTRCYAAEDQLDRLFPGPPGPPLLLAELTGLHSAQYPEASSEQLWTMLIRLTERRTGVPGNRRKGQWLTVPLEPRLWLYTEQPARPDDRPEQKAQGEYLTRSQLALSAQEQQIQAVLQLYPDLHRAVDPDLGTLIFTRGGFTGFRTWTGLQWMTLVSRIVLPASREWHLSELAGALALLCPERFARAHAVTIGHLLQETRTNWAARYGDRPCPLVPAGRAGYWKLATEERDHDPVDALLRGILMQARYPMTVKELRDAVRPVRSLHASTLTEALDHPDYLRLGRRGVASSGRPVWLADRPLPDLTLEQAHVQALINAHGPNLPAELVESLPPGSPIDVQAMRRAGLYTEHYRVVQTRNGDRYLSIPQAALHRLRRLVASPLSRAPLPPDELNLALSCATPTERARLKARCASRTEQPGGARLTVLLGVREAIERYEQTGAPGGQQR